MNFPAHTQIQNLAKKFLTTSPSFCSTSRIWPESGGGGGGTEGLQEPGGDSGVPNSTGDTRIPHLYR